MHPVGYLYEDYHDARSLEHKVLSNRFAGLGNLYDNGDIKRVWKVNERI